MNPTTIIQTTSILTDTNQGGRNTPWVESKRVHCLTAAGGDSPRALQSSEPLPETVAGEFEAIAAPYDDLQHN